MSDFTKGILVSVAVLIFGNAMYQSGLKEAEKEKSDK